MCATLCNKKVCSSNLHLIHLSLNLICAYEQFCYFICRTWECFFLGERWWCGGALWNVFLTFFTQIGWDVACVCSDIRDKTSPCLNREVVVNFVVTVRIGERFSSALMWFYCHETIETSHKIIFQFLMTSLSLLSLCYPEADNHPPINSMGASKVFCSG